MNPWVLLVGWFIMLCASDFHKYMKDGHYAPYSAASFVLFILFSAIMLKLKEQTK